jgi:hypothetical protein
MASLTIGTKLGVVGVVVVPATLDKSSRIARRQPNTCCEQTCQRRATSDTRAPGTSVSATIRAFSSADQRRRRPGPVRTSTRRYLPFASSLTSNIRIARSPVPQTNQALPGRPLKKGSRAPLTRKRSKSAVSTKRSFAHGVDPNARSWAFSFHNPLSESFPKAIMICIAH